MSLTWKDALASASLLLVVGFTGMLMTGAFDANQSRWAFGTLAIFVIGGLTGILTGASKMLERAWSASLLYILSAGATIITLANAFINSEAWFIAMAAIFVLMWLEFVLIDFFSPHASTKRHLTT